MHFLDILLDGINILTNKGGGGLRFYFMWLTNTCGFVAQRSTEEFAGCLWDVVGENIEGQYKKK